MRFTSLFAIAATLSTTVLSVHADQQQHQPQKQQPVSVYLHPSPQGQHEHEHGHQVPTLTGEQAHMVLSHHFGLAGQGHSAAAANNQGEKKKGFWSHLLKPHGRPTLQSPERAKIIVVQGDVIPSDVLPVTSSEDLAEPAFHLAPFPAFETMHFLQPYLAAGERAVSKFLSAVEDGVEHGFDRIWNEVTAGSEDKRGLKSLLDVTDSRAAQILHAQLSALSQLVHPSTSANSESDQVWESTVVHVPGRPGAQGEEEELRQTGLSFIRASVQALLATPNSTPFVLIILPTQTTTSLSAFKSHAKRIYSEAIQTVGQSKIIGALPLDRVDALVLKPLVRAGEKVGWGILIGSALVLLPLLLVAGNVFRQVALPRDPTLPPLVFHYIPWFGSAATYGMDPYKFLFDCREQYGDLFTFILLGRRMTVALGPKGNNLILGGKLSQVSAEDAYTHLTTPVFGKGVVYDCPNEMLMQQKRMVKFGLSTENFKSYVPLIKKEATDFMNNELKPVAGEWKHAHALHSMAELTILTASATLQGKEVRGKLDKTFARRYEALDGGFTPINFMFPNLPLPSYKKRDKAQREMSEFYQEIIRGRREGGADHDHDMIAALMSSAYRDGTPLSDSDIAHMMIALLMAGQHTSSATSSWTLLHLADRPDVYEELYQEQKEKFGNPDGTFRDLTYEDLKDLPLLDSCIRETLRIHAPIHSIMRKVMSDIPVPTSVAAPAIPEKNASYVIPEGHFVLASPGVAQMDPKVWQDASIWNPHRWVDEKGVASKALAEYDGGDKVDYGYGSVSKGTESPYQPFGAGRHRCIGESFAYLQLQTILATFIRNMEMKLEEPFPKTNYQTMVVLPLPAKISYRLRK